MKATHHPVAFEKMMEVPEWQAQAEKNLWSVNYRDQEGTIEFLEAEGEKAKSALRALGLLKQE